MTCGWRTMLLLLLLLLLLLQEPCCARPPKQCGKPLCAIALSRC